MKVLLKIVVIGLLLFGFAEAKGKRGFNPYAKVQNFNYAFKKASKKHKVPIDYIKAVILVENTKMDKKAIRKNKNGTKDYGLGQINTIWMTAKETRKLNLTPSRLMNPEVNIDTVAYLLSLHIKKRGLNYNAIGCYHSKTPSKKKVWLKKFKKKLTMLRLYELNHKP